MEISWKNMRERFILLTVNAHYQHILSVFAILCHLLDFLWKYLWAYVDIKNSTAVTRLVTSFVWKLQSPLTAFQECNTRWSKIPLHIFRVKSVLGFGVRICREENIIHYFDMMFCIRVSMSSWIMNIFWGIRFRVFKHISPATVALLNPTDKRLMSLGKVFLFFKVQNRRHHSELSSRNMKYPSTQRQPNSTKHNAIN